MNGTRTVAAIALGFVLLLTPAVHAKEGGNGGGRGGGGGAGGGGSSGGGGTLGECPVPIGNLGGYACWWALQGANCLLGGGSVEACVVHRLP